MKYFFVSGEVSGDLHAAKVIKALKSKDDHAEVQAWGGDQMALAGAEIKKHINELAFMGFAEVVKNLPKIWKNFRLIKAQIKAFSPDVLVLVDYPGFNMRLLKWAKEQRIKIVYYIAPQAWAWKPKRSALLNKYVDKLCVILPFEEAYFRESHGINQVEYVGHPLMDALEQFRPNKDFNKQWGLSDGEKHIAVMPGSREQEVLKNLPPMAAALTELNQKVLIAQSPTIPTETYHKILDNYPKLEVKLILGANYDLLSRTEKAIVTSGTATLETALLGVPQVVCYRASSISIAIAKKLITVKYISLVNLILDEPLIQELIQGQFQTAQITEALSKIDADRPKIIQGYNRLKDKLGSPGASERVAEIIMEVIKNKSK